MKLLCSFAAALAALACVAPQASAQPFPSKTIRIIVPFTPGGGNDVYARAIAPKMQERLGQPVIVENKPGAGGNIGAELVAKSDPDGHMLLVAQNGLTMAPYLTTGLPFDVEKDFAPVGIHLTLPMVVVVNPELPVKSIKELIAYAKANPGKLSYAFPGRGTPQHLATELFRSMTGTDIVPIPYKGAAGMMADLMGGQVHLVFNALNSALPHIRSGKIRAIAIGERERLPAMGEVPTIGESLPGYEAGFWFGLVARAGTPEAVISRLSRDTTEIVALPDVAERLKNVGFEVKPGNATQMRATMKADMQKWAKVVKDAGIKPLD